MEITPTVRQLPNIKLSKRVHKKFDEFTARIDSEGLHIGMPVTALRTITDSRDYVLKSWYEPAVIVDVRNFDVLVKFADGEIASSGCNGGGRESLVIHNSDCSNPNHDHIDGDPESERYGLPMLCTGCDKPAHWDESAQDYFHDSADTPDCFMIRSHE